MPDPPESLSLVAEVAVAIAGFSGIVVVLGRRASGEWTLAEQTNLQNVLIFSLSALFLALVTIALLHTGTPPARIWRIASGLWLALAAFLFVDRLRVRVRIPASDPHRSSNRTAALLYGVSTLMFALSIANVVTLAAFWPFQAALTWSLLISCDAFARLLRIQARA